MSLHFINNYTIHDLINFHIICNFICYLIHIISRVEMNSFQIFHLRSNVCLDKCNIKHKCPKSRSLLKHEQLNNTYRSRTHTRYTHVIQRVKHCVWRVKWIVWLSSRMKNYIDSTLRLVGILNDGYYDKGTGHLLWLGRCNLIRHLTDTYFRHPLLSNK